MSEPTITEQGPITVVGVGGRFTSILVKGSNSMETIPALWDTFIARMKEIEGRSGDVSYGVCASLPAEARPSEGEFHYIAGAPVADGAVDGNGVPEGMERIEIPAATYAVFRHEGRIDRLRETYESIMIDWLPRSGYRHAGTPELERYDERFTGGDDSVMEILIPVIR